MTQVRMIHYITHQAVIRKDKSTSKLRIVYNASAKTTSVLSLIILAPSLGRTLWTFCSGFMSLPS